MAIWSLSSTAPNDVTEIMVPVVHTLPEATCIDLEDVTVSFFFWCQYFIDGKAAILISSSFHVLKYMLILMWSNMNPLFLMWM